MAFKTISEYNEERYGGMFILKNDRDYADVIFLYRSIDDVLVADTHYLKSADYSGYVHCCGKGCPACNRGIRVQNRLFIPLYNINENQIQFFDRSTRFESRLQQEVFSKFPNPSEYVFRITRIGEAGSWDTRYDITPVGKNNKSSYEDILNNFNVKMPDHYNTICRDITPGEMEEMFNTPNSSEAEYSDMPEYQITPRVDVPATPESVIPEAVVDIEPPTVDTQADIEDLDDDDLDF